LVLNKKNDRHPKSRSWTDFLKLTPNTKITNQNSLTRLSLNQIKKKNANIAIFSKGSVNTYRVFPFIQHTLDNANNWTTKPSSYSLNTMVPVSCFQYTVGSFNVNRSKKKTTIYKQKTKLPLNLYFFIKTFIHKLLEHHLHFAQVSFDNLPGNAGMQVIIDPVELCPLC